MSLHAILSCLTSVPYPINLLPTFRPRSFYPGVDPDDSSHSSTSPNPSLRQSLSDPLFLEFIDPFPFVGAWRSIPFAADTLHGRVQSG